MKLRNKKTGEIVERVDITIREVGVVFNNDETYDSLAELNEEWEDYKPKEPLIKDEKVRKVVRAWAEASGITKVLSYGDMFWIGFRSINTESVWKFECFYIDASEFKKDKEYTIAELCGEVDK